MLKYILLSLLTFVLLLVLISEVFEKKITSMAFDELRSSINLPMDMDEISFTLLRSFPLASIEVKNVKLGSPEKNDLSDPVQNWKDTIVNVDRVYFSVTALPLLDGIFDIQKVEVMGAHINYVKDSKGVSNFDFLIDTTTNEPDTAYVPDITLKEFSLENLTCHYTDSTMQTKARVFVPELSLHGRVFGDVYSGSIQGMVNVSEVAFENTNIDRMRNMDIDFDIAYVNDSLHVNIFDINSDGVEMGLTGMAVIRDNVYADLNIRSDNVNFGILKKYIPEDTLRNYGVKNIEGKMLFNVKIHGVVSDTSQMPYVDADLWLENGSISLDSLPDLKDVYFDLAYTNGEDQNSATSELNVKKFRFRTGNSKGNAKLSVRNFEKPVYDIKADLDVDLADFEDMIPDTLLTGMNGRVKVKLSTKGIMPDSVTDDFINNSLKYTFADLRLSDVNVYSDSLPDINSLSGRVVYKPGLVDVSGLSVSVPDYKVNLNNSSFDALLSGVLTDPAQTKVELRTFKIHTDNSSFSGKASLRNLITPDFSVNADLSLDLQELMQMMPDDSLITDMSGRLVANIVTEGHIDPDSMVDQAIEIILTQSRLKAQAADVSVSMADTLYDVKGITGNVTIVPDTLMCANLTGAYKNMTFDIPSLCVVNIYNTIIRNRKEPLTVTADVRLGDMDYAVFAPFMPDTIEDAGSTEESDIVNYSLFVKGKFAANSFKYGKAEFRNISALYNVTDSLYIVDKFRFEAFGGTASNSVRYRVKPDGKVIVNTKHIVDRVDIHQVLSDFDNFEEYGNNEVSAENLGGVLSSKMNIGLVLVGDSIVESETKIKGDMKLENGGVYNYKPAMDMAEFTGLKELDSIRFKTFDSKIFMLKNKLYVPRTYIVSSALDIGFFGMQSLGEDYEYHIQLHLRDVLKGKSEKLLKRQQQSGDAVSDKDIDRNTVKLIYSYLNGKSKVGFDRKKAQRMMELKIKTQEKMLDLIFFPKLVSFDTGVE